MSESTNISYVHYSWSPWWGCTPWSPGCVNCYASLLAARYRSFTYRKGGPRQKIKDWKSPQRWNKEADLANPPRVLVSMCDIFDEEIDPQWRADFFLMVQDTPNLRWLVLTKRPENIIPMGWSQWFQTGDLDNVWLGVSVEDQERASRIQILLEAPAKLHWVSVEPLLSYVNLPLKGIDWCVVGGESGGGRRDCGTGAIANVVSQCLDSGVPVFVKQDCALKPGQKGRISDFIWSHKQFPKA